jgi:hypothetical protein
MKHLFFVLSLCTIAACSNSKEEKAIADIKTLESNSSFAKSDTLINSYINFSDAFFANILVLAFNRVPIM